MVAVASCLPVREPVGDGTVRKPCVVVVCILGDAALAKALRLAESGALADCGLAANSRWRPTAVPIGGWRCGLPTVVGVSARE